MKTTLLTRNIMNDHACREADGYAVVSTYTDVNEEYRVLRGGVGLIDLSAVGKIKVTGESHVEFINELVTKEIEFLDIEKSLYTLLLDDNGQVIDLINVYKTEDAILIETSITKRSEVLAWLNGRKVDDVEIEDLSEKLAMIGLEGPYAWKVGQRLIDFEISSLPFQAFVEIDWNGHHVFFARTGVTGEYGYKVIVQMDVAHQMWETLLGYADEDVKVQAVGMDALEIAMMEVRQPNMAVEGNDLTLYEACLEWLVSFDKEDFTGFEAINSMREQGVKQRVIGFVTNQDHVLDANDAIVVEETNVGKVLQICYSPTLDKKLGLAVIHEDFAVSGIDLEGLNQNGERVRIQTQSSPYTFPKSWSIKII
ncbi:aminomethyltransferase family protein [Thermoactinomyces sp. DSM 45892]|uniref:aminomethyltransferase family protein n=1 Tax=Thermoactinomyces sp. DSM 45892 TaxID=1882753 RepID=UPI0008949BD5|nr:aminomethyltransferase family protein [Thermoactinomyces sp. DSM 45892]SDY98636.1 Glycine cleavage system T protein (aminomethyltransferase) [Thermoactinomyces sp. DSM 45892]